MKNVIKWIVITGLALVVFAAFLFVVGILGIAEGSCDNDASRFADWIINATKEVIK